MLELRAVTVGFGGKEVFAGLDLTLPEAGLYLFLGPNSSGKTVLLNLIGGRLAPRSGQVLLGGVPVYGFTGPELPRIEHLSREAVGDDGRSLHRIFLEHVRAGGNETPAQALAPYDAPWSEAEMKRLKPAMLPHGERLEFELLCAFARKPEWLLVDDYLSRLSFEPSARVLGNLLAWQQRTGGTALLTSTRFFGFMEELRGVYLLRDGRVVSLAPPERGERGERGEVLIVCGEYFYRHSRAQEDNPHLLLKAVLENALVIEVKSTLDEAVKYLGELGIDVQAVVLAPEMDSGFAGRGAFF